LRYLLLLGYATTIRSARREKTGKTAETTALPGAGLFFMFLC